MRPFRFRAAIVLELRQKQDEEAQRALGRAKAEVLTAQTALDGAAAALGAAMRRAAEAEASAEEVTLLQWYRNWMAGRQADVTHCREQLEARRAVMRTAAQAALKARRELRVIERYRERVWQAWQRDALREEQKELDLLGTMQYAARHLAPGGQG
ncbi:MAG TPA: flagellar FliJ family protein [Vicinamibacterales bacterium]|nr:flagellar FliJ family protein [Vicinamibacterales bacterium]